jgi:hypothetical protein
MTGGVLIDEFAQHAVHVYRLPKPTGTQQIP